MICPDFSSGWWFNPSEKYESQLGSLFPIYGTTNVPNHQPVMVDSDADDFRHAHPLTIVFYSHSFPMTRSHEHVVQTGYSWFDDNIRYHLMMNIRRVV